MAIDRLPARRIEVGSLAGTLERYRPVLRWLPRQRWPVVLLAAAMSGGYQHIVLPDQIRFAAAGGQLLRGRLAEIYAQPWQQGGPFELIGSWLVMPLPAQHRASYIRVSDGLSMLPLHLAGGALLFAALMFAVRGGRRGTGLPAAVQMEVLAGALGLVTLLPHSMWFGGHLSQLVIPFCWLWGAQLAVRGRLTSAALVLGLCAGWESWGVLAAPLLLLDRRPRALLRNGALLGAAAALPYLPFVLAGPFRMFDLVWHVAPWSLLHALAPSVTQFTWPMRLGQTALILAAGSAVVLLLGRRRETVWLAPVTVTVVRQLADPLQLPYYWLPFFVLVLVGAGMLGPQARAVQVVATLSLACLPRLMVAWAGGLELASAWAFGPCLVLVAVAVWAARRGPEESFGSRRARGTRPASPG